MTLNSNFGEVYLVGSGPGDPELLTLKAARILSLADIVFYDQLVNPEIFKHCKENINLHFVGKERSRHSVEQESINELLYKASLTYKVVVRLKGGDPSIFGRVGEELEYLLARGVKTTIIPGITTASGGAASIGMPLTHRNFSSEIIFLTGHKKDGINLEKFKNFILKDKTLVLYMGLFSSKEIVSTLLAEEKNASTPVLVLENATLLTERIFTTSLESLSKTIEENQIKSPAILYIGDIVEFYLHKEKIFKTIL